MIEIPPHKYEVIKRALEQLEGKTRIDITSIGKININIEADRIVQYVDVTADSYLDKPLEFKVNWSAIGRQPSSVAREYADMLYRASDLADFLTNLELKIDWQKDSDEQNEKASVTETNTCMYLMCMHLLTSKEMYSTMFRDWLNDKETLPKSIKSILYRHEDKREEEIER